LGVNIYTDNSKTTFIYFVILFDSKLNKNKYFLKVSHESLLM